MIDHQLDLATTRDALGHGIEARTEYDSRRSAIERRLVLLGTLSRTSDIVSGKINIIL